MFDDFDLTLTHGDDATLKVFVKKNGVETTVSSGASSVTQALASTEGMTAGDNLYFAEAAAVRVIASVDSSTAVTLTQTVSTTAGEQVTLAQDLTDWSLWLTAKKRLTDADADAVFQLTSASGITLQSATGGYFQAAIGPDDYAGLDYEKATLYADVQGKDGDGKVHTLAKGMITIEPDVTRATE